MRKCPPCYLDCMKHPLGSAKYSGMFVMPTPLHGPAGSRNGTPAHRLEAVTVQHLASCDGVSRGIESTRQKEKEDCHLSRRSPALGSLAAPLFYPGLVS